jgi:hypothetical protein
MYHIVKSVAISIAVIVGMTMTLFAQGGQTATGTAAILKAQQQLQTLGYQLGTPDGTIGPRTVSALKKFQSDHSLSVTGKLDQKTLDTLSAAPTAMVQTHTRHSSPTADSAETRDWASAVSDGTSEAYLQFYDRYPASNRLTVYIGPLTWCGMLRFNQNTGEQEMTCVKIGDRNLSPTSDDLVTLGQASRFGASVSVHWSDTEESIVLLNGDKIVASKVVKQKSQ